jgi:hypothetical protein
MKSSKNRKDLLQSYNSTIFTNIYRNNHWGGKKGEFYSGPGSHNQQIVLYAETIAAFIAKHAISSIVEIGCGDFNVSKKIIDLLDKRGIEYDYTGYDVVKPLIDLNNKLFKSLNTRFIYKDGAVGRIKSADLLIVRQVLQHLSNNLILKIVKKFSDYEHIIVTEHQLLDTKTVNPNMDIQTSSGTRLEHQSGVYLDQDPFNCIIEEKLFSILQPCSGHLATINTFLIKNNGHS